MTPRAPLVRTRPLPARPRAGAANDLAGIGAEWRRRWQAFSPRGLLLYVLPLPLVPASLISLLRGDYARLGAHVLGIGLLFGGALLARRGLRAEARWRRRHVARAPRPWKTAGGVLLAAGAAVVASGSIGHPPLVVAGFALAAFVGFALAYGLDPRRAKPAPASADGYSTAEVEQAIDEAEAAIARIEAARAALGAGELGQRLGRITDLARQMVARVEAEPRHLRRARRFLRVYLDGTQQVCEGWARTHGRRPAELDERFRRVLVTIEDVFAAQREKLLADEVEDLDVQVEVLAQQLRREGVGRREGAT
jgi:hypothetical protein